MPGLGVKRWAVIVFTGITLIAVGSAFFLLDIYRTTPDTWWLPILSWVSLRFLSRSVRVLIFGSLGITILLWGMWGLNRALMAPFLRPGKRVVDTLTLYRRRERGARIVVIGGGTGLSTLLRGLKSYTHNLTAIVTVADDGGSSGRLRRTMGILPPGDIRNCLAALSNDEALITQLFQYRFARNGGEEGLEGHSFGNLFLSAMTDVTGSFEEAIAESGRVLSVSGRVLPATLHDVHLVADIVLPHTTSEVRIKGESRIPETPGKVRRIWLEPNAPPAFPRVIKALLAADMIVVGPGSLYTSILPNLLVPDIAAAVRASRAMKAFVCNVATQPGETHGYSCSDHLLAIEEHLGDNLFDVVICNKYTELPLPDSIQWVHYDPELMAEYAVHTADVVDRERPWRHNAAKLAKTLIDLYQERTGPLAL